MADWLPAMSQVRGGSLSPVYLLKGEEPYLIARATLAIAMRAEELAGEPVQFLRFRFDDEGASLAMQACKTVSLFSTQSVVSLEHCTALVANSKSKHETEELEAYLADPVPNQVLIVSVLADKVDERKKLTKLCKQHQVIECTPKRDEDAAKWLQWIAEEEGVDIAPAVLAEVWRRSRSVSVAVTELQKLRTYCYGSSITLEDVQEIVTPSVDDSVFSWVDAVIRGDALRAFATLRDVELAGYEPLALLAMITRQLRLMWFASWYGKRGMSQRDIAAEVKAHPYAVKVAADQARMWSSDALEELLMVCADAEYAVKSGRQDMHHMLNSVVMSCIAVHNARSRPKRVRPV